MKNKKELNLKKQLKIIKKEKQLVNLFNLKRFVKLVFVLQRTIQSDIYVFFVEIFQLILFFFIIQFVMFKKKTIK